MLKNIRPYAKDAVFWHREMGIGGLIRGAPGPVIGIVGCVQLPSQFPQNHWFECAVLSDSVLGLTELRSA